MRSTGSWWLTTQGPGKEGGKTGWMAGWRNRIGRMGNHYANEAGLNHTVPMIICWEKPRLLGSLVCSTVGTYFYVLSLTHFFSSSLFPSILHFSYLFFPFPLSSVCTVRVCVVLYLGSQEGKSQVHSCVDQHGLKWFVSEFQDITQVYVGQYELNETKCTHSTQKYAQTAVCPWN